MIIYEATKHGFLNDVDKGVIADKILEKYMDKIGNSQQAQINSWRHSMGFMASVMSSPSIPNNAQIAIEYRLPYTAKRIDFMVSGISADNVDSVVIVELKQWGRAEAVEGKEEVVSTFINNGKHEVAHPAYQAWSYKRIIEDYNENTQKKPIKLYPCAYMHNYPNLGISNDPVLDKSRFKSIQEASVFVMGDQQRLSDFIARYIHKGDSTANIMYEIEFGRIRPSKSLQDALASMMKGNTEFTMIDTQKVVYETAVQLQKKSLASRKKEVLIVKGGPGTGKSVLAINLLTAFTQQGLACHYVTKNSAPREVYFAKLCGAGQKKSYVSNLFKSSGVYVDSRPNDLDVVLVDEAHRLNIKSGMFSNKGENQTMEIIRASLLAVFFIDEAQKVTAKDAGSIEEIKSFAKRFKANITEMELDSQFRCNGSDGYLAWVDNFLGIHTTANDLDFGQDYDFKIFDDPVKLRKAIEVKNSADNKSRLVAGYCWEWIKDEKDNPAVYDIVIPMTNFKASWNLGNSKTWAIDPDSVKEVGCIHTCQGLEFDYVGVIIGNDLRFENGRVITDFSQRAHSDKSLSGLLTKARKGNNTALTQIDQIIRNTYRTLLTRGMKGCYVYCTDKALANYLREMVAKTQKHMLTEAEKFGNKLVAEKK